MSGTASRASLFPTQIEKAGLIWEEDRGFFLSRGNSHCFSAREPRQPGASSVNAST